MSSLTAQDILAVWEAGQDQHPVERALTILRFGFPGCKRSRLARLPLGRRDRMLLELRARTFGDVMTAVTRCPKCGESLEVPISVSQIGGQQPAASSQQSALAAAAPVGQHRLRSGRLEVRFRLPTSEDLEAAAITTRQSSVSDQPSAARQVLLQRCVTSVRDGKTAVPVKRLTDKVASALEDRMAELDPLAEITLALTCPQCGNAWEELLDPVAFLWAELADEAKRLLSEVHVLARAYGWRESDVLALSARRRKTYLEFVS